MEVQEEREKEGKRERGGAESMSEQQLTHG